MALVDERGRIAGRVNLVDAMVAIALLLMVPVGYGAYLLFRTPPATIVGVSPAQLYQGNNLRVQIEGRDLRPFMRVSFNDVQGRTFLIGSTTSAQVDLPDLPPGKYDVVLYDYQRELDRLPQALTILPLAPAATVELEVAGAFMAIAEDSAAELKPGLAFASNGAPVAKITSVGEPVPGSVQITAGTATFHIPVQSRDLPATVRVQCAINSNPDGTLGCMAIGTQSPAEVTPGSSLTWAGPRGWLRFQVAEVHASGRSPVVEARVRFIVTPEQLNRVRAGAVDGGVRDAARRATITSIGAAQPISAAAAGPRAPLAGELRTVDVGLRVPVEHTVGGWMYKAQPFKIGAPFSFETDEYLIRGEVANIAGQWPPDDVRPEVR